ncbi:MAG TPA: lipopolysaccharide biosynthesis protein [Streptosporangiaceae bacterium]|nr:lipopolysaccharide biosynthesis protein [Streptosporangiaceae bacterium]
MSSGAVRREESVAAQGARWIAVAMVIIGLLNYGYALLLTHLLDVAAYSKFAAGQGLILWASTVATVSVPWVLAQALVRARSDTERNSAIRFAKLASAGSGLAAAAVVGTIATRFAGSSTALALAVSVFVIFLGTTTTGWLQGRERMRALSALMVGENLLKNGSGVLLVMVAGLGDAGALGAFGIGGIVLLLWWPRTPHGRGRLWLAVLANRDPWRRAVAIAGAQGVVSLFVAIDVVLVALLPGDRALAASYQASAALSRVPFYVASAVAMAFFPSLSRRATGGVIAARAVRMYAAVALPIAAVLATIPAHVLTRVFPTQYTAVAALMKYTALTGLAAGGISLVTALFQAADDHSCFWWLGAGLAGYVGALLAGWRIDGITGLAAGGALGTAAALVLAGYRLARRQGRGVLAWVPLGEPVMAAAVLIVLRPYQLLWLAAASLVGLRAVARFVRPVARHARRPRWAALRTRTIEDRPAVSLLMETVWRGTAPKATDAELDNALDLARRNRVEGRLARAYPAQLPGVVAEVRVAAELFARHLYQVVGCLNRAGIPAVLIPVGLPGDPGSRLALSEAPEERANGARRPLCRPMSPPAEDHRNTPHKLISTCQDQELCDNLDHVGTSIDLVVPEQHWRRALSAVAGWYVHRSTYRLERFNTAVLYPSAGPRLHLHASVSWFGVPVLPTDRLLSRARRNRLGFLIPAPADCLRIWLAQALFQDLALDLSRLLKVCDLLHPAVITAARAEASREGWHAGFDDALATAVAAIDRLDHGLPVRLPAPLTVSQSLGTRAEHADHWHPMGVTGSVDEEAALAAAQTHRG